MWPLRIRMMGRHIIATSNGDVVVLENRLGARSRRFHPRGAAVLCARRVLFSWHRPGMRVAACERMTDKALVENLNRMLAEEHACAIRYATHAATVAGPYAEAVSARLKEISGDEVLHAEKLRDRILALGGTPTMQVSRDDLTPATTLAEILKINMEEERGAIESYTEILKKVSPSNVLLFQTIQEIIRDEQEHLEELEALREQPAR